MLFTVDEIRDEVLDFAVRENKEDYEIDHPDCSLAGDIEVAGTLRKSGVDVYLSGKIQTQLSVICSRCLEPFEYPVDCIVTTHFVPRPEVEPGHAEVELHASDIDTEFYDENRVNITPSVHDQIVLALPLVNLCKKDCKGLCPDCGKNLNLRSCDCVKQQHVDPRLEVLKSLKDKLK